MTIGDTLPPWSSEALVDGQIGTVSSNDLAGAWYVLYWYPRDFTSICPTELNGFERLLPDFSADGVRVIGASTDSVHSHRAWFADRSVFPDGLTHPVLGDPSHHLSRLFGVLDPASGAAYRATFIVDDQGRLRSMSVNDVLVGRSPNEVLRTTQALLSGGLCGANWKPGDRFAA